MKITKETSNKSQTSISKRGSKSKMSDSFCNLTDNNDPGSEDSILRHFPNKDQVSEHPIDNLDKLLNSDNHFEEEEVRANIRNNNNSAYVFKKREEEEFEHHYNTARFKTKREEAEVDLEQFYEMKQTSIEEAILKRSFTSRSSSNFNGRSNKPTVSSNTSHRKEVAVISKSNSNTQQEKKINFSSTTSIKPTKFNDKENQVKNTASKKSNMKVISYDEFKVSNTTSASNKNSKVIKRSMSEKTFSRSKTFVKEKQVISKNNNNANFNNHVNIKLKISHNNVENITNNMKTPNFKKNKAIYNLNSKSNSRSNSKSKGKTKENSSYKTLFDKKKTLPNNNNNNVYNTFRKNIGSNNTNTQVKPTINKENKSNINNIVNILSIKNEKAKIKEAVVLPTAPNIKEELTSSNKKEMSIKDLDLPIKENIEEEKRIIPIEETLTLSDNNSCIALDLQNNVKNSRNKLNFSNEGHQSSNSKKQMSKQNKDSESVSNKEEFMRKMSIQSEIITRSNIDENYADEFKQIYVKRRAQRTIEPSEHKNTLEFYKGLYNRNLQWKKEVRNKSVVLRETLDTIELKECSFTPRLKNKSNKKILSKSVSYAQYDSKDFYTKNLNWKSQIEKSTKTERLNKERREYEECSFHPTTGKNVLALDTSTDENVKKGNDYIYKKNIEWLRKVKENRNIKDLELQEEFKQKAKFETIRERMARSKTTRNSLSLETEEKTEDRLRKDLITMKDPNSNFITSVRSGSNKDFSTIFRDIEKENIDREIKELKSMITSLKTTLETNKYIYQEESNSNAQSQSGKKNYISINDSYNINININIKSPNDSMKRSQSSDKFKLKQKKSENSIKLKCSEEEYLEKYKRLMEKYEKQKLNTII